MAGRALDRVTVLGMSAFGGGETGARAIVSEYKITLSELEHSSRAREQNFWTTRRRARPVVKLVLALRGHVAAGAAARLDDQQVVISGRGDTSAITRHGCETSNVHSLVVH